MSMNFDSSLLILCGDTLLTDVFLDVSNEKLFWCESLPCIDVKTMFICRISADALQPKEYSRNIYKEI